MYTATLIRKHINNLPDNKPFSIRDFLNYGSRNAVDQVFYRLVKLGTIVRLARGLFIKDPTCMPSVIEIAAAKAAAFKRTIVTHGSVAAIKLGLTAQDDSIQNTHKQEAIFACSGHSSSFRFGDVRIYLKGTSARKMSLADTIVGLAIRALWYLSKTGCTPYIVSSALSSFGRNERQTLRSSLNIMPVWLHNYFVSML